MDVRKKGSEALRKRKKTLFKKAYELGQLPNVEIAVIIHANGRYSTYRFVDKASWPPDMKHIVNYTSGFDSLHIFKLKQQSSYPLPKNLLT
jgi:hypothetical protein